jgi:tRNA pseudouridine38-40 synthase
MALNDRLPADINVLAVESVPHRFHARRDALARRYLYQISRRRTAFAKPFVWWVRDALDVAAMRAAAAGFVGLRDYRSFTDDAPEEKSTRVLIERIEIEEEGDFILIRVLGSHFLWKMVRRMVGVLVEVGRGRLSPADVEALLLKPSDLPARVTAPPSGLFLERVLYEGESRDAPLRAVMNISAAAPSGVSGPAETQSQTAAAPAHRRRPAGPRRRA